jgi:hypothetical protein
MVALVEPAFRGLSKPRFAVLSSSLSTSNTANTACLNALNLIPISQYLCKINALFGHL